MLGENPEPVPEMAAGHFYNRLVIRAWYCYNSRRKAGDRSSSSMGFSSSGADERCGNRESAKIVRTQRPHVVSTILRNYVSNSHIIARMHAAELVPSDQRSESIANDPR